MGEEEAQAQQIQHASNAQVPENVSRESSELAAYSWPAIRFDVPPARAYHFCHQFRASSNPNNFLCGVKWSPDGSCFLTCSDDRAFRVFALPDDGSGCYGNACCFDVDAAADSYAANLVVNEGESIYDYCWYPYMSASDPVTSVFASTTRDHPIHLWDSTSGELRCTYRAYDDKDEITAAYSIGFNPSGTNCTCDLNQCQFPMFTFYTNQLE